MPLIEHSENFQAGYQQFRRAFSVEMESGAFGSPTESLVLRLTITHIRAATNPSWPSSAALDSNEPFLPPIEVRQVLVGQNTGGTHRNIASQAIRSTIVEAIRNTIGDFWGYYGSSNVTRFTESQMRFWGHWTQNRGSRINQGIVANTASKIVQMLHPILQEWECPDGENDCHVVHTRRASAEYPPSTPHHVGLTSFRDPAREEDVRDWGLFPRFATNPFTIYDGTPEGLTIVYALRDPRINGSSSRGTDFRTVIQRMGGILDCSYCGEYFTTNQTQVLGNEHFCLDCSDRMEQCSMCQRWFTGNDLRETEVYDEDEDDYISSSQCNNCYSRYGSDQRLALQPYSHKPDPQFHYVEGITDPLFMGMELEVARTSTSNTARVNQWIRRLPRDLFYVKSDSSVSAGMEVVTHPFTYGWAAANFPYQTFQDLIEIEGVAPMHDSAGTHIHVSKAAFDTTHMWKFILMFLENHAFFGQLGERGDSAGYGRLTGGQVRNIRENLMEIVKLKGNSTQISSRGIYLGREGVNLLPEETIELRFLAGNVKPEGIKKNQQLVKAVYEFTKTVKASDALKGALADPGYFMGYVVDSEFTELVQFMDKLFPRPKKLERTS